MVKSGLEFILKLTEPLQSCCCPVQKNLPSRAELAWQVSRYLWRGLVNFKMNSRPLFTIIFNLQNVNFKTRDFSPLIEWVLDGVSIHRLKEWIDFRLNIFEENLTFHHGKTLEHTKIEEFFGMGIKFRLQNLFQPIVAVHSQSLLHCCSNNNQESNNRNTIHNRFKNTPYIFSSWGLASNNWLKSFLE